ncbi:MAG TPA: helix-turn-helix domain-containing protein [Thermoplasmata archaeon]|nr:helix-turn-helix domain-containing protein [Thermoplasmata archaeon]HLE46138.1 helix-turn-helix domain-containing protein [Thermoplasmata archaeon]
MARTKGARTRTFDVKVAAVRLLRSGMAQAAVAEAFDVDPSTVSRWWALARRGGANALMRRPVSGRPRKLPLKDLTRILAVLREKPSRHGFPGSRWSPRHVAQLIRRETGVSYHPSHVSRLLLALGRK